MTAIPQGPGIAPPPKNSGCLKWAAIGCAVVVMLGAVAMAGVVILVFGAIRSTDAYKDSLRRAQNDPRVIAAIGAPVKPGWYVTGNVNVNNADGTADINYPISGSRGEATVHVVATRSTSGWSYSRMTVDPDKGSSIDLLSP